MPHNGVALNLRRSPQAIADNVQGRRQPARASFSWPAQGQESSWRSPPRARPTRRLVQELVMRRSSLPRQSEARGEDDRADTATQSRQADRQGHEHQPAPAFLTKFRPRGRKARSPERTRRRDRERAEEPEAGVERALGIIRASHHSCHEAKKDCRRERSQQGKSKSLHRLPLSVRECRITEWLLTCAARRRSQPTG